MPIPVDGANIAGATGGEQTTEKKSYPSNSGNIGMHILRVGIQTILRRSAFPVSIAHLVLTLDTFLRLPSCNHVWIYPAFLR